MPHESLALNWRRYDERYVLMGSACKTCEREFFPKRVLCPDCKSKGKIIDKKMPWEGTIVSSSKVHVAPQGYEFYSPYYLAIIELTNKVRLLGQLVDTENKEIKIGSKVKKVFRKVIDAKKDGVISYGYKFKVVK